MSLNNSRPIILLLLLLVGLFAFLANIQSVFEKKIATLEERKTTPETLLLKKVDALLEERKTTPDAVLLKKVDALEQKIAMLAVPLTAKIDKPNCSGPEMYQPGRLTTLSCCNGKKVPMCVHQPGDHISDVIASGSMFEGSTCQTYMKWLSQFSTDAWVLDFGANIGTHTLCIASAGFPVLAVEATPWNGNIVALQSSLHPYPKPPTVIQEVALASKSGMDIHFIGTRHNYGGSTSVKRENHPNQKAGWGKNPTFETIVPTTTIDQLLSSNVPAIACIALMKMDVEGAEYNALQGATELLSERPPCLIMMEYHSILLKAMHSSIQPWEVVELLQKYGYRLLTQGNLKQVGIIMDIMLHYEGPQRGNCVCPPYQF